MKQVLAVFLLLAGSIISYGQASYATVTGTVVDGHSNPYAYARLSATLVSSTGVPLKYVYFADGSRYVIPPVNATLGSDGAFSVSVLKNSSVSNPTGTKWQFAIGDPNQPGVVLTYSPSWSITYSASITADVSLSTPLNALAQDLTFVNLQTGQSTIGNGGGPPTALSPNPTLIGQTWGYLPGAAPNQGWTNASVLEASITDFGAACDGVTPDDAAWAAAEAAGVAILVIPPSCSGFSVVSTPLDLTYLWELIPYMGITYTGTGAGPGIKIIGQSIGNPLQVQRGTSTAGQILVEVVTGPTNFGNIVPGLIVTNAAGATDNNYISVHFKGASFGAANLGYLYTDSPVTIDAGTNLNVDSGTINNLNGLTYNSGDPVQIAGSFAAKLSLNNVTMFDGKTSNGCFIPLKNNGGTNPAQVNLHNVQFIPVGSFSGHGICGPSTTASTTDIVNGDVETSSPYDPSWTVNGQVDGHLMMVGTNLAGVVSPAIEIVNGIAANFFYSAAGVAIPTPYSAQSPALAFVSDQTTACTGSYTSGAAVKCKVWWDGTNWIAY